MDELDSEEQRMLAGARRVFTPSAQDAERVLSATQHALLLPAAELAAQSHAASASSAAGAGGQPFAAAHGLLETWTSKLMAALVIAGTSGMVGFYLGVHTAAHDQARATRAWPTPKLAEASAPSAVMAARAPTPVPALAPVPEAEPAQQPTRPAATTARAGVANGSATPTHNVARPALTPPVKAETFSPDSLQAEISALRRVERALRDDDPRLAITVLDQLDRNVPDGKLAEERLAAFVMARCALGLGTSSGLFDEFGRKYPQSVYSQRVRRACSNPRTATPTTATTTTQR